MERNQKIRIIVLLIIIVGLGIGFAAFSSTINVSTSVSVTPNSNDFKVCFSTNGTSCAGINWISSNTISSTPKTDGYGYSWINAPSSAWVIGTDRFSITDVGASTGGQQLVFTSPNERAIYTLYILNTGRYTAYLDSVTFGSFTCSYDDQDVHGISSSDVCNSFSFAMILDINNNGRYDDYNHFSIPKDSNDIVYTQSTSRIDNVSIPAGEKIPVRIAITYDKNGKRADGPITVTNSNGIQISFTSKPPRLCGDVNDDGVIDDIDLEFVKSSLNGSVTLSNEEEKYADVDSDGSITLTDANKIENVADGTALQSTLTCNLN